MFTGIIAEQGHVLSVERDGDASATLRLHAPGSTEGLALGGSVAVNSVVASPASSLYTPLIVRITAWWRP